MTLNKAPPGTKLWILDLGTLETDAGFVLRGANLSTKSNPEGPLKHDRRKLCMHAVLIEHPQAGLILFECGPGRGIKDDETGQTYEEIWGSSVTEYFCRVLPDPDNELPAAIAKTGHDIKDIKHVILGHLHIDHAGGLVFLRDNKQVTLWTHEIEIKHAFWSLATDTDSSYMPHYLDLNFKWRTISESEAEIFQGITMVHLPGHTPGLTGLQVNLDRDGPFIFTTDHFHIQENYQGHMQGLLIVDAAGWYRSTELIRRKEHLLKARVIPGHDYEVIHALLKEKDHFE